MAIKRKSIKNKAGYILDYRPEHPRADRSGYVFAHILAYEDYTGKQVPVDCAVHHINGNKADNRPENLELLTRGEHSALHNRRRTFTAETKKKISEKAKFDEKGNYVLCEEYTEILKLDKMLTDAQIPHTLDRNMNGWQIVYPDRQTWVADAIETFGSYGNEENLLEIMGLLTPEEEQNDSVVGWLTAEDVFRRFSEHYKGETK